VSSAQAIRYLDAQRDYNGIPAGLVDNPSWDTGCADHILWDEGNATATNPHQEVPGTPGYTKAGDGNAYASASA